MRLFPTLLSLFLLPLLGCDRVPEFEPPSCDEPVCSRDMEDGTWWTTIDATDKESLVWFSFADFGAESYGAGTSFPDDDSWDLGFQRYIIWSNGGVTGPGAVEVSWVDDTYVYDVDQAPVDGWIQDSDGSTGRGDPFTAFLVEGNWYLYQFSNHILQARVRTYVVHAGDGNYYAMQFTGYYDADGVAGNPGFIWKPVAPPEEL